MRTHAIEGGFASPVLDAQAAFRAVMGAMAEPGKMFHLAGLASPPSRLSAAAAAMALTLCDQDTPVWLDATLRANEAVGSWLGFHTGAPLAHTPADAQFAIVCEPAGLIALDNFAQGTQDYPDRAATLILEVESLDAGPQLMLQGPGIQGVAHLAPTPLPRHFVEQWRQNNGRFPRGVDVILAAPGAIACLSRTTRITSNEV